MRWLDLLGLVRFNLQDFHNICHDLGLGGLSLLCVDKVPPAERAVFTSGQEAEFPFVAYFRIQAHRGSALDLRKNRVRFVPFDLKVRL